MVSTSSVTNCSESQRVRQKNFSHCVYTAAEHGLPPGQLQRQQCSSINNCTHIQVFPEPADFRDVGLVKKARVCVSRSAQWLPHDFAFSRFVRKTDLERSEKSWSTERERKRDGAYGVRIERIISPARIDATELNSYKFWFEILMSHILYLNNFQLI